MEYFPVYFLQSTLQEKGSHESSIADLHRQLKELRQENDMLLEKYLQVSETGNNWIIFTLCLSHKVIYYLNSETGHHNNQQ